MELQFVTYDSPQRKQHKFSLNFFRAEISKNRIKYFPRDLSLDVKFIER